MDFPFERNLEDCLKAVEAKPFSRYFDEQLDAAEELYGIQLYFNFSTNDVKAFHDSYRPPIAKKFATAVKPLSAARCALWVYCSIDLGISFGASRRTRYGMS